jgi:3-dehydroquinate synthase
MNNIETLEVRLGERSYPIIVGAGLIARADEWVIPRLSAPRVIIVTDSQVGPHYAKQLSYSLQPHGIRVDVIEIEVGEGSKSFGSLEKLMNDLLALTPDRKTTILALGGGVVGDLTGFAASILLRGVPFMQIPTTLLAQVDSSVGGKTAINTVAGKNLVGSFYQPKLVLADIGALTSLPKRQMLSGYAEIIKYGLIMDAPFYQWCLTNGAAVVAGEAVALQKAVLHSCRLKADIVARDETEADARGWLNFGHTFGHALEAETGYSDTLLHGEAVAIGMVMACRLSARMGLIGDALEHELTSHLRALGLPSVPKDVPHAWNAQAIAAHFAQDKKAEGGELTFIVLDKLGAARVAKNIDAGVALEVVESFLA